MSQSSARDTTVRTDTSSRVSPEPARPQSQDQTVTVAVPRHRTLDGFVDAVSQADGIGLADVDAFTTLVVQTDNSVYQITILQPHARDVYVQGGAFFPVAPVPVSTGRASAGAV